MKKYAILFLALAMSVLADAPALKFSTLDNDIFVVRASRIAKNFAEQLNSIEPADKIVGTILDLRFADGDSDSATAVVKLFSAKKTPLVILMNGQTRGAAAELALQLRAADEGILIGSTNSPGKVSPDIAVDVSADAEKKFMENPLALPTATNTQAGLSPTNDLLSFVDHTSEAELVRQRVKDGEEDDSAPSIRAEPAQPVIRDPALARAVDLLKALAILNKSRG